MDLAKISSKHQITIGKETFLEAGFEEGEVLAMRSTGPGRVEIWSVRAVLREKAGRVTGAAAAHARIREMEDVSVTGAEVHIVAGQASS